MPLPPMLPGAEAREKADRAAGRHLTPTETQQRVVLWYLGEAYATGRLTKDELDSRRDSALAARTVAGFDDVLGGLVLDVREPDDRVNTLLSFTHTGPSMRLRLSAGQLDAAARELEAAGWGSDVTPGVGAGSAHAAPYRYTRDYLLSHQERESLVGLVAAGGLPHQEATDAQDRVLAARRVVDLMDSPAVEQVLRQSTGAENLATALAVALAPAATLAVAPARPVAPERVSLGARLAGTLHMRRPPR